MRVPVSPPASRRLAGQFYAGKKGFGGFECDGAAPFGHEGDNTAECAEPDIGRGIVAERGAAELSSAERLYGLPRDGDESGGGRPAENATQDTAVGGFLELEGLEAGSAGGEFEIEGVEMYQMGRMEPAGGMGESEGGIRDFEGE